MNIKISKQYRRRLIVFGGLSVFIIFWFFYSLISYISTINDLKKEEEELNQKLVELKKQNVELKSEIDKLKNPDYLAKYARESFLYSKDGEYIIRIDENDDIIVEIDDTKLEKNKKIVFTLGIAIILISLFALYKIRKSKKLEEKIG